jgi:hypothetical protein
MHNNDDDDDDNQNNNKGKRRVSFRGRCDAFQQIYLFKNVGFASPCIIILSNESPDQMQKVLRFFACRLDTASTCFGHPHAHHKELNNCNSSLWFTVRTW